MSRRYGLWSIAVICAAFAGAPNASAADGCSKVAARTGSDTAAGTAASPFMTAQKLVSSLKAGETGCLRGGDYTEIVSGYVANFATAGTTLRSYPGERARLVGIIQVRSTATATTLADLDIEGPGTSNTVKIYAADVVVENNDITNAGRGRSCMMLGSNSGAGGADRVIVRRNVMYDCGSPANTNKDHAIYASNVADGRIVGNVIANPSAWAIQLYPNARRTVFAHNVVDGGSSIRGGVVFGGDSSFASVDNVVEHNVLAYPATWALASSWGNQVGSGNLARNNCVYQPGSGMASGSGYTSDGNVSANPAFVNRAARDYRLGAGSGCLSVVGYDTAAALAGEPSAPTEPAPAPAPTEPAPAPAPTEPAPAPAPTEPAPAPAPTEPAPAPAPTEPAPAPAPTEPVPTDTAPAPSPTTGKGRTKKARASVSRRRVSARSRKRVKRVVFYVNGRKVATDRKAPFVVSIRVPRGARVTARGYGGGRAWAAAARVA